MTKDRDSAKIHAQKKLKKKKPQDKPDERTTTVNKPAASTEKVKQDTALDDVNKDLRKANQDMVNNIMGDVPPTESKIDISNCYDVSTGILKGYASLDESHRKDIFDLITGIVTYSKDKKRKRPLNIVLQADPGSGKSHFIQCLSLSERLVPYDVKYVGFNMAAMERAADLIAPLETVRNVKARDCLPLLFLDEFDSKKTNLPILLPLLWDGEFQVEHHLLQVGRCIIVLAGSQKKIEKVMVLAKSMNQRIPEQEGKLVDLLSRVNGGELIIPRLDGDPKGRNRTADKVCIAISLLVRRFRNVEKVPWCLLKFISKVSFTYGVRSIEHLIDKIETEDQDTSELTISDIEQLPLRSIDQLRNSSLAYHIHAHDGATELFGLWQDLRQHNTPVTIRRMREVDSLDLFLQSIKAHS